MRVKVDCHKDDKVRISKILIEEGIEVSDINPTHIFKETGSIEVERRNNLYIYDIFGNQISIPTKNILLVESFDKDIEILLIDEVVKVKPRLYQVMSLLPADTFVMINKSQIVSLRKIKKISPQFNSRLKLTLSNGDIVFVSRTYLNMFKLAVSNYRR